MKRIKLKKLLSKKDIYLFKENGANLKIEQKRCIKFTLINFVFRPPRVFNDKLDSNQQKKINLLAKHIEYLSETEFQYLNYIL